MIQAAQKRLLDVRKTWKQQAYSKIIGQADHAVEQISETTTPEDLDQLFANGMKMAVSDVDALYDGVQGDLQEIVTEAQNKLDEIGASPLAKAVDKLESEKGKKVDVDFTGTRPDEYELAAKLGKAAAKPIKEGLEIASQNAETLRNIVYTVGKKLGKKFRPWEAVKKGQKLAEYAGKAGKVMPYLAAALDLYIEYRQEKVKEEKARYLANLRMSLRNAFADQAKVEAEALEAGIIRVAQGPFADALERMDAESEEISSTEATKATLSTAIVALRGRCTGLRSLMLGGVEHEIIEG